MTNESNEAGARLVLMIRGDRHAIPVRNGQEAEAWSAMREHLSQHSFSGWMYLNGAAINMKVVDLFWIERTSKEEDSNDKARG